MIEQAIGQPPPPTVAHRATQRSSKPFIKEIVLHYRPHLDEIVALWLLREHEYSDRFYRHIREADLVFWDAGTQANRQEQDGRIFLGVGGGPFDEHPVPGTTEQKSTSCAQLVAEALKISRRPELYALLRYTTQQDLTGGGILELAALVNQLNAVPELEPEEVVAIGLKLVGAHVHSRRQFLYEAKTALEAAKQISFVVPGQERELTLIVAETESEKVKSRAFSDQGGHHAAVIQRDAAGRTQLFINRDENLDLTGVVAAIRQAELKSLGRNRHLNNEYLTAPGTLPEIPQWFYFPEGNMLANGTLTAPHTRITRLSLEEIVQIFLQETRSQPQTEAAPAAMAI